MPSRRAIKARITKSALKARQAKAEARARDTLISKARLLDLPVHLAHGNIYLYGGYYLWAKKGTYRKALKRFEKEIELDTGWHEVQAANPKRGPGVISEP
jgi:hypothetical protein